MVVAGRLKDNGSLLLSGGINERLPSIRDGLVSHVPFDGTVKAYVPSRIRYIRDWNAGSPTSASHIWMEIQAIDTNGVNVALNKPVSVDIAPPYSVGLPSLVTNGDLVDYFNAKVGTEDGYVIVDLEGLHALKEIKVWHYFGDARTFYKTKTEVSVDGKVWFSIFDSAIEGEYAEVSSGRTHTLANLGVTVSPLVNANTTLTDDCIAVEEATTNLWAGNLAIYNNYAVPASITKLPETYLGQPVYRLAMTVDAAHSANLANFQGSLSSHGVYGSHRLYKANTKYAASIYWRPINKLDVVVGGTASNMGGNAAAPTKVLEDGWRRYYQYRDGTVTTDKSDNMFFSFYCPSLQLDETIYIDFCCPQIEEGRDFPTSYVNGSRSGSPLLTLPPSLIDLNEGTIACWFNPSKGFFSTYSWNRLFGHSTTANGNEIQVKRNNTGTNLVMSISNSANSPSISWQQCPSVGLVADRWYHVVARWSKSMQKMSLTVDGVKQEQIGILNFPTVKGTFAIGYHPHIARTSNALFEKFSVYNRYLTDIEVAKLFGQSFSPTQEGDLLINKFIEKKINLPSDVIHLPLDFDGTDRLKLTKPSSELNTVYEKGAMWIGAATTNIAIGAINVYTPYHSFVREGQKITFTMIGDNKPLVFSLNQALTGRTLAISGLMKINGVPAFIISSVASTYNVAGDNKRKFFDGKTGYFELVEYYSHATNQWIMHASTNTKNGDVITIENLQIEERPFVTPFVNGTRPYGKLNYAGTSLTKNNWQEFTLMFRAKYSQSGVYRLSGAWSRFYFGVNTGNAIMLSWVDGTQKSVSSSGVSVPINEWVDIAVTVKNDVAIDLYFNGNRVGGMGPGFSLTSGSMDFGLNGLAPTDTSYPLNAWVKDLIFAPRALTAVEIKNMQQVKYRAHKEKFQVEGSLLEGQTL